MAKKKQDKKRKEQIAKKQVAAKQAPLLLLKDEPIQQPKKQPPTRQEWNLFPALQYMSIHSSISTDACVDALMQEQSEALKSTKTTTTSTSTAAAAREEKQHQQLVTEVADKAIAKHFRRASVRVHPDRFGDTYLTEFEHLKQAYDILRNKESRMEYASKMLDVVRTFGLSSSSSSSSTKIYLQQAHDAFAKEHFIKQDKNDSAWERYAKAKAEAQSRDKNNATATSAATTTTSAAAAYIEAEHYGRTPGWLDVYQQNAKTRQLELGLKFRNWKEYQPICQAVVVQAEEIMDSTSRFVHRIEHDKLQRTMSKTTATAANHNNILKLTITLPTHTTWNVRWYAELQISTNFLSDGTRSSSSSSSFRSVTTSMTYSHIVDLTHPDIVQARQQVHVLQNTMAKRHIALLRNHTRNLHHHQSSLLLQQQQQQQPRSTTTITTDVLEAKSWELHRALSRGRSIATRLQSALERLDQDPEQCKELTELVRALTETSIAKSTLDERIYTSQRRDTLKSFKQNVARMIESGKCAEWIQTVHQDELHVNNNNSHHHGATTTTEVNRLYQLLIEGKKANSLLVDATILSNAAARTDLFSTKQCKTLQERALEVETEMIKETQRMMEEERKQKALDEARRQIEERARRIDMERGTCVAIVGLKNRPELNGQLGYYLGVAQNFTSADERYIIKLAAVHPPKEVALKKENFQRWEGNAAWSPTPSSPLHHHAEQVSTSYGNHTDDDDGDDESAESVGPELDSSHENKMPSPVAVSHPRTTVAAKSHHHHHHLVQATHGAAYSSGRPTRTQNTAWIPRKFVRSFIGPKGTQIQKLQLHTRTKMHVAEKDAVHTATAGDWVPVTVHSGSKQDVQHALDLIEAFDGKHQVNYSSSSSSSSTEKGVFQQLVNNQVAMTKGGRPSHASPSRVHQRAPVVASHSRSPVSSSNQSRSTAAYASSSAQLNNNNNNNNAGHSISVPKAPPPVVQHRNGVLPQGTSLLNVLEFLANNKTCLKVSPEQFDKWLQSQDILSLKDLAEATHDEEFMVEMQKHGLKGFKKAAFTKIVLSTASGGSPISDQIIPTVDNGLGGGGGSGGGGYCSLEGPSELYCPISMVLMKDPVLAADGYTYERSAIVSWFERNAVQQVVLSPMTQEPLRNLELVPNVALRNLALSFA